MPIGLGLNESRKKNSSFLDLDFSLLCHCRVEQNLTSKKFPRETEGAISTSATRWFENWSYFHFWLASKREAQYLSLELRYIKNFKNGNFLHLMTQLLLFHNFFLKTAHKGKKCDFRRPPKNPFFGFFSTFSLANQKIVNNTFQLS